MLQKVFYIFSNFFEWKISFGVTREKLSFAHLYVTIVFVLTFPDSIDNFESKIGDNTKCTRKQTKWAPGLQNEKWFSIIHLQYSGYNLSNSKCDQFYGTHCTMHMYIPSSGIIHFKFWYDSQKNAQQLHFNWWRAYYTCWNFNTAGYIS